MPHPSEHVGASEPLRADEAERLAELMSAFAASSRLKLLYALVGAPLSVDELAGRAGLSQAVTSQQLRVLRQLGAVSVRRDGRRAFYRLRDHHLIELLAAIRHHGEHVTGPAPGAPSPQGDGQPGEAFDRSPRPAQRA